MSCPIHSVGIDLQWAPLIKQAVRMQGSGQCEADDGTVGSLCQEHLLRLDSAVDVYFVEFYCPSWFQRTSSLSLGIPQSWCFLLDWGLAVKAKFP